MLGNSLVESNSVILDKNIRNIKAGSSLKTDSSISIPSHTVKEVCNTCQISKPLMSYFMTFEIERPTFQVKKKFKAKEVIIFNLFKPPLKENKIGSPLLFTLENISFSLYKNLTKI